MNVAVIGIGNVLVADDGIGILAVRELQKVVADTRVMFVESEQGGLDILDHLNGRDGAILIDAARTGTRPPGALLSLRFGQDSLPQSLLSLHTVDLGSLLALGYALGLALPAFTTVVGVEAEDTETFGAPCSPSVMRAFPRLIALLVEMLHGLLPGLQVVSHADITLAP